MNALSMPKLILHFDVNGTLTAKDTSKKLSDDHMIIALLAENTIGQWAPSQADMSFKDYVYTQLHPGDKSDPNLKLTRQKAVGSFLNWLLNNEHQLSDKVFGQFLAIRAKYSDDDGKVKFSIFTSFFVALQKLRELNIAFTVVLRTFGTDLEDVVDEIQKHPSGVQFTNLCTFKEDVLKRQFGVFESGKFTGNAAEETVTKTDKIFKLFAQGDHFAVQDDWKKWNQDGERSRSGKPFIVDSSDTQYFSIFFDDNITGEDQDIISLCDIASGSTQSTAIRVDTLNAMLNDQYFINKILIATLDKRAV